jgi:hypothetical protein
MTKLFATLGIAVAAGTIAGSVLAYDSAGTHKDMIERARIHCFVRHHFKTCARHTT